ncbi:MAG: choice-of-anchor D domain-containing protein [Chloroflexi bacterium]|nr:choice-of-anchor D domain-containing protein [Chloroflexota bacterium]
MNKRKGAFFSRLSLIIIILLFMNASGVNATSAPSPSLISTGTITNLVVFVRFSGEAEFTDNVSTYTDKFTNATLGADSMKNYFLETSYNQLTVNSNFYPTPPGSTVISYQDSHTRDYFRPYHVSTNPIGYNGSTERFDREYALMRDAVAYVDGLGQFPGAGVIDANNDGLVDSITFIVSGSMEASSPILWPHKWSVLSLNFSIAGKQVFDYIIQMQTGLHTGLLSHEMFHLLTNAPDLYNYTYIGFQPVGTWDLMEGGSFDPPQHMNCYMKYRYGHWIASIPEISAPGTYTLNPITSSTNNCYKIESPNSTTEFFILEYRRNTGSGFESTLPGSGLLVYRINANQDGLGNAGGPPDEVYLYRPGGTTSADGNPNNAHFSSDVGRTAINDATNPSSFLSNGSAGGLNICNIGAAGATISFDICSAAAPEIKITGNGVDITDGDTTPSLADHTNFGSVVVNGGSVDRTFTIQNINSSALNLTGSPDLVSISGANAADFSVTENPSTPLGYNDSTTFTVRFDPQAVGGSTRTATISIANNDGNENPYNFTIQGTASDCGALVTNSNDSGAGSLQQALLDVCTNGTITFDNDYTILLSTTLEINKNLTIDGTGHTVILDGQNTARVLINWDPSVVTVKHLTIRNGNGNTAVGIGTKAGGGILNFGTLTVDDSIFTGNNATDVGGAMYNWSGAMTVTNSAFSSNGASTPHGGGIFNEGSLTVTGSVFSSNSASTYGGGIFSNNALTVANSAFSQNSASYGGGFFINGGAFSSINNTLSANQASSSGGGIFNNTGVLNISNTIVANSTGGDCTVGAGTLGTNNNNLIEGAACGMTNGANGNIVGLDPNLGALASNGGPTQTFKLLAGSPAFNAGDDATCAASLVNGKDQRGISRPQGAHCDIGSYEAEILTVTANSKTITYGGSEPTFDFAKDPSGATFSVEPTCSVSGAHVNAGTYAIACSGGVPTDGKYLVVYVNGSLTINKANATINVTGYSVIYDGAQHTASGSATGVNSEDLSAGLDLSGTAHTNVGAYLADPWTFTDTSGNYNNQNGTVDNAILSQPEMNVTGNSVSIADGDAAPSLTDFTDFGSANVTGATVTRTFAIQNLGGSNLTLSGAPKVSVTGPQAANFTVTIQPSSPVTASGSTTFTVRFDPSVSGLHAAIISIANNDANENPYNFSIQGIGTAPEMNVLGNGVSIVDGDATPSTADFTNFGSANIAGVTVTRIFTIQNLGTASLTLSGAPKVSVSGAHASDFVVTALPVSPVTAAGSTTFSVRFDPSASGIRTAIISIANDDANENPYNFTIQGLGTQERAINGGFNLYSGTSKIPTNWVKSATFATTDGKDTSFKKEGSASVKIGGQTGKTKTLTQTLNLSGNSGDQFIFSFWERGSSIPSAGLCKAEVLLYQGTALKLTKTINCRTGTYAAFEQKMLTFNATSAYTKVEIKFTYSKSSGSIWFDLVSLIK